MQEPCEIEDLWFLSSQCMKFGNSLRQSQYPDESEVFTHSNHGGHSFTALAIHATAVVVTSKCNSETAIVTTDEPKSATEVLTAMHFGP